MFCWSNIVCIIKEVSQTILDTLLHSMTHKSQILPAVDNWYLRKVTPASNASTKRDYRQRQLFFIICLENQWYYMYGFGYFLHQKDKTEKNIVYFVMSWMQKSRKIFLPDFVQHSTQWWCVLSRLHTCWIPRQERGCFG